MNRLAIVAVLLSMTSAYAVSDYGQSPAKAAQEIVAEANRLCPGGVSFGAGVHINGMDTTHWAQLSNGDSIKVTVGDSIEVTFLFVNSIKAAQWPTVMGKARYIRFLPPEASEDPCDDVASGVFFDYSAPAPKGMVLGRSFKLFADPDCAEKDEP